jgi:hypothetical protein
LKPPHVIPKLTGPIILFTGELGYVIISLEAVMEVLYKTKLKHSDLEVYAVKYKNSKIYVPIFGDAYANVTYQRDDNQHMLVYCNMLDMEFSVSNAGNTHGTLGKATVDTPEGKVYLKASGASEYMGIYGHEAESEYIASNIGRQLGIECVNYDVLLADINLFNRVYTEQFVSVSYDYTENKEVVSLEEFIEGKLHANSVYGICLQNGWKKQIHDMFVFDYIIMNDDRHISWFRYSIMVEVYYTEWRTHLSKVIDIMTLITSIIVLGL